MWNLDQFLLQRFGNSDTNDPHNDLPIIMSVVAVAVLQTNE